MQKTQSEIILKIRRMLANPSEEELSDDQIVDVIEDIIKVYSRYRPIIETGMILTKKDVALYDLKDQSEISPDIIMVFYIIREEGSGEVDDMLFNFKRLNGLSLWDNPSLLTQFYQKIDSLQNRFKKDWLFEPNKKMLTLIPPPSRDNQKIAVIYGRAHDLSTIPDEDEDLFIKGAFGMAGGILFAIGRDITQVSSHGQTIHIGNDLLTYCLKQYDLFLKELRANPLVMVG